LESSHHSKFENLSLFYRLSWTRCCDGTVEV